MQAWMRKNKATTLWRSNNRPLEMEAGHERSRERRKIHAGGCNPVPRAYMEPEVNYRYVLLSGPPIVDVRHGWQLYNGLGQGSEAIQQTWEGLRSPGSGRDLP
jgi:hypothetical protein